MRRCPLCAGLSHEPMLGQLVRCKLCSLVFGQNGVGLPAIRTYETAGDVHVFPNWNSWLAKLTGRPRRMVAGSHYFSPRAVRMFAARCGQQVKSIGTSLPLTSICAKWPYGETIRAAIGQNSLAEVVGPCPRLTLGIIAAPGAGPDVIALCVHTAPAARDVVVALDTGDAAAAAALEAAMRATLPNAGDRQVLVTARPLGGDFAAQRNWVQQHARTDWVLQLDCDERLTDGMAACLPRLIVDAEEQGWDAVGFTRRNLVDGVVSALYPDPQFRLLRRSVRFTRPVHEYPDIKSYKRSYVHLGPGIIHHIAAERLDVRAKLYEGIEEGAGRPGDTDLLRQPLEADVSLPV